LLLFDEPLTHLDEQGTVFYRELTADIPEETTVIVCSNHLDEEFGYCRQKIMIKNHSVIAF